MSVLADLAGAQGLPPALTLRPEAPNLPSAAPLATLGVPPDSALPSTMQIGASSSATYTGTYTTIPRPVSDSVSINDMGQPVLPPNAETDRLPSFGTSWFENLSLFFGVNGFKEPADLGINANFGYRLAVNWGLPLFQEAGIGLQVGSAVNYGQNAIRILPFMDGTTEHWQSYTTVGLFQRSPAGLRWGFVYDFRFDDYYDRTSTGQWRGQIGFETKNNNEFGVLGTFRDHGDSATIGTLSFAVEPISQWNFYWRHVWANEIVTRVWLGLASEHSRFSVLIPGQPPINHPFTFGGDFYVPLTDNLALFGDVHVITPADSGAISAMLGVVLYPGSARGTARSRFAPLFPVANNTSFALDVR
jgi:hypothetical protein